jgi:EAL domain-containing protein (putative c-di-GMP-specific phosphodiesterase class I)
LKIDGAFVRDLAVSQADYALVKSMNEVGHSLGIKTVAEYVESEEILAKLKEIGVDYVQGFHIGRPMLLAGLG